MDGQKVHTRRGRRVRRPLARGVLAAGGARGLRRAARRSRSGRRDLLGQRGRRSEAPHLAAHLRHQRRPGPRHQPADGRAPGRQPLDGVQLGEQRLQRRQRLVLPERRLPVVVRTPRREAVRPDIEQAPRRRARPSWSPCRSSTTSPPTRTVAATCATPGPTTCRPGSSRTSRRRAAALALTPNATDGFVYQDEYVNWLKTNQGDADMLVLARQRARPLVVDPCRGPPEPVALRRAGAAQHRLRHGHQGRVADRQGGGPRELRLLRLRDACRARPDAANRNFLDFYLQQMKAAGRRGGQAPHRLPGPALVSRGDRRRRAHHRDRHERRSGGRPGPGAALAVGPHLRREPAGSATRAATTTAPSA